MVQVFAYSRTELESSTVEGLRKLVRKHNLHNQIKRYSKMRKADLVEQLLNHSQKKKKPSKAPKRMDRATKALVVLGTPNKLGQPLYKEGVLDITGGRKRTRKPKKRFAVEG